MNQDERYRLMRIASNKQHLQEAVVEMATKERISQQDAYYTIYYRIKSILPDYQPYSSFESFYQSWSRQLRKKSKIAQKN